MGAHTIRKGQHFECSLSKTSIGYTNTLAGIVAGNIISAAYMFGGGSNRYLSLFTSTSITTIITATSVSTIQRIGFIWQVIDSGMRSWMGGSYGWNLKVFELLR